MDYWDRSWANFGVCDFKKYINMNQEYIFLDYFKTFEVQTICDVGCGFGKYSAISSFNNFDVYGIDISDYAINLTERMLKSLGLEYKQFKVCKMSEILYRDNFFDGIIAHAVIDHIKLEEAKKSILEISRITKPGGIVYISFDGLSDEDIECEHEILEDGSMVYITGDREGMIFHYYNDSEIEQLLNKYEILYFGKNSRGDREIVYKNSNI